MLMVCSMEWSEVSILLLWKHTVKYIKLFAIHLPDTCTCINTNFTHIHVYVYKEVLHEH